MTVMHTLLWFLVAIAILVVVHEFGHYLAARLAGVKVLRFSVGFGRPLVCRRFGRDQTEWVIAALPLGGYVKMLDEREAPVDPAERHRAFNRASVWRRIGIVAAGPAANFLLAIAFYGLLFVQGIPALRPLIDTPPADTPAARAGLVAGDEIQAVNGQRVTSFNDLRLAVLRHGVTGGNLDLTLADGRSVRLVVPPLATENLERDLLAPLGLLRFDPPMEPVVGQVLEGGAAQRAGVLPGDRILSAEGTPIESWQDWVAQIRANPGWPMAVELARAGSRVQLTLVPERVEQGGQVFGRIGAAPQVDEAAQAARMTEIRHPPLAALAQGAVRTWEMSVFTLEMLGRMLVGQVSWKNLSGPVTIADYAGQSAAMGWLAFVSFLALISISLGVINLLPIPLLDGGHLLYYFAEVLTGRPVSERTMEVGARVGMTLLFLLMSFAFYNDLQRLFSG